MNSIIIYTGRVLSELCAALPDQSRTPHNAPACQDDIKLSYLTSHLSRVITVHISAAISRTWSLDAAG